jgi:DNA-directed RNA polymerase specialized sigma24 family protein
MTAAEALHLFSHPRLLAEWAKDQGLDDMAAAQELRSLLARVAEEPDQWAAEVTNVEPPAPAARPGRDDTDEIRAFVAKAPQLHGRLRQVFQLCIEEGLTLFECGARLGITRETVRVHLRRLRVLVRRARS